MSKNAVVIVAAGRGERLGTSGGPKQYRQLAGHALLWHTLRCFLDSPRIDLVQVVIHQDDGNQYESAIGGHSKLLEPVTGGVTRQASCKAGIDALPDNVEKVLIHDAARPFVPEQLIENTLAAIRPKTCALPAVAVADTVKRAGESGNVLETVPRENLHLAQTPQGFLLKDIRTAHGRAARECADEFTDDAAVAEWAGLDVQLVCGDRRNFKVTTTQDFREAEAQLMAHGAAADVRTGSGYDVHALGPGDHVILCGIRIPHSQSLIGHSDADAGMHALTDALLGTVGEGDIGDHFPPSDPQWKDVSSDRFLKHAVRLVREAGGNITNLDVTIICEKPKIGPFRKEMRARLAEICNANMNRVSVKATTNEKIGFIGREEGIAALATATVSFGTVSNV